MTINETSTRTELELAALELGMANTAEECQVVMQMSDDELFRAIQAFIEAGNEVAPY